MQSRYKLLLLISAASAQFFAPALALEDAPAAKETSSGDTIIVEGRALLTATTPVQILSGDELFRRRQGTLGETLSGLPGVHMDNFGGGAARPVIRGQTVPRIEVLTDGAQVFDASSVSPDHAVVTDPLLLDAIEIQRGPAAVIYGGNAVNGAINLIDSKVPKALPESGLSGAGEARYSTTDDGTAFAGRATMAAGPFAFHVEGSASDLNDYDVPDEYGSDKLKDSFAQSSSYSVGASWITDKGYIGAAYTVQEAEYGLPGHSHINAVCHTHGTDLHCAAHGGYEDPFGSSDDHTAKIDLRSDRVDVRADYDNLLPGLSHARLRFSYTDYTHDEVDGPSTFANYVNEAYDGRLELTHQPLLGFTGVFGVQYTDATFSGINVNDLHEEFPENGYGFDGPYYHLTENVGVFLSERRSFGAIDLEIAVRKDWRNIDVTVPPFRIQFSPPYKDLYETLFADWYGPDWREVLRADYVENFVANNPSAKHKPLSASLGATWNIDEEYSVGLSLAHTERPPSVRELYAYGNNLATNSYEVGLAQSGRASSSFPESTTDVMEKARSVNLTFRKIAGATQFEIGVFHQDIDDYIFARLIETDDETGSPHNYLLYTAADARFTGVDGQISHQVNDASRLTLFGDYVHAHLKSEDDNLPRIPPGRLGARYDWERGPFAAGLEYYRTFAQEKVASYETETDGYDMLGATAAYRLDLPSGRAVEVYARGSNLTNELAFVHTSFVKDQSPLRGRNIVFGVRTSF